MKSLAIIGLDPGITSAYVVLDLQGNILKTNSGKELTSSEMISQIISLCQPLITATDKAKIPSFVEEISRKLGTETISPPEDLTKEEKRLIIHAFNKKESVENIHQSDSLAAALFAYKKYRPKLEKINRYLAEKNIIEKKEEFTKIALTMDLPFALIQDLINKPAEENRIIEKVISEQKITKKDFLSLFQKLALTKEKVVSLEKIIQEQQTQLSHLIDENKKLVKKPVSFSKKVDTLFQFKENRLRLQSEEIKKLLKKGSILKKHLQSLYQFTGKTSELQLIKKLPHLGQKEFKEFNTILNLGEGDFLFIENPDIYSEQVLTELTNKKITVLSTKKISKNIRNKFQTALIIKEDFRDENDYFALMERKNIEKKINTKELIEQIINDYQEKRRRDET